MNETSTMSAAYINDVVQARRNVRELLALATERFDPWVSLRELNETMVAGSDAKIHTRLNTALMDYRDQIAPHRDEVGELWDKSLGTVPVGDEELSISLSDVDEFRNLRVSDYEKYDAGARGIQRREITYRVLLPVEMVVEVYTQLNDCVKELGLTMHIEPRPAHSQEAF